MMRHSYNAADAAGPEAAFVRVADHTLRAIAKRYTVREDLLSTLHISATGLEVYSSRKATVQSTDVARRRGSHKAAGEVSRIAATAEVRVGGSHERTWKRSDSINRPTAKLPLKPIVNPMARGTILWRNTSLLIALGVAPTATRIPISRVRDATRFERTP
jgi:hypothetical protein